MVQSLKPKVGAYFNVAAAAYIEPPSGKEVLFIEKFLKDVLQFVPIKTLLTKFEDESDPKKNNTPFEWYLSTDILNKESESITSIISNYIYASTNYVMTRHYNSIMQTDLFGERMKHSLFVLIDSSEVVDPG